ncbi:ataxin-7-like protein 1 [Onthophagus taurus]|uniref:ataxin-7-like protein 1 n=1 Tax=Onthophagus taurus TaxID=166361 RepID=UPI000C2089E0|nr:ataxin-7-like protein 1 [Onthophagus taurus]XP_022901226.1 ataxin-7-like protein 1 [Onthophagus taurus]XP_022901228.1 ataxin-7-like protein 1 [Onthophagus taurus]XP_022901229.1 ataxin-7-like protein 1 [Onthophagus taurus]XP_022901230.1 ataxin-7-like protein 1 [Onthophagus taurus]
MSGLTYPSLKPFYNRPWGEWFEEVDKCKITSDDKCEDKTVNSSVSLLPRKDILLYGTCPKNDVRVLCRCERCNKLLMPVAYVKHMNEKHGPDQHPQSLPVVQPGTSLLKKKYSHSKNKKKINPPPVPPPPLFQTYEAPVPASPIQAPAAISAASTATTTTSATAAATATAAAVPSGASGTTTAAPTVVCAAATSEGKSGAMQPVHAAKSEHEVLAEAAPNPVSPAGVGTDPTDGYSIVVNIPVSNSTSSSFSSSSSSSKHKKSKKSSKKVKEFDPDKHCGVFEGNKGPCLRSITCSNHMIHLRKAVPGRSKDLHQLIADHKASKDKETVKQPVSGIPKATSLTTSSLHPVQAVPTSIPTATAVLTTATTATTKSSDVHVITQPLHISVPSTGVSIVSSQGNNETCTSVVYMPMSPVAVVSPVQLGGPILRVASTQPVLSPPLATQPIVVTIPVQTSGAPQYPAHPKPLVMSSSSTRKIGGTFVLQNQRIDRQRSEIQVASNARRAISNSCTIVNTHHKPNILKNSVRSGGIKTGGGVKRQASDKLVNDNNKHIRLSDVNGFILHADVSEGAEAPQTAQTNNSIHEKVAFINMK